MRVEYGVKCKRQTYWPTWSNWLDSFRAGRWVLAHLLAWDMEANSDIYACGPHRVVRRTTPTPEAARAE